MSETNNENLDKKPDLGSNNPENKDNLKESFSDLKNELNKLKNQIREGEETKKDEKNLEDLDKEIQTIDREINKERIIEKEKKDGNLSPRHEQTLARHMQKISTWLKNNPGESNQGRVESATQILNEIYGDLEPNPIANSMQKIIRFILSL